MKIPKKVSMEIPMPKSEDLGKAFLASAKLCELYAGLVTGDSTITVAVDGDEASITVKGKAVETVREMADLFDEFE